MTLFHPWVAAETAEQFYEHPRVCSKLVDYSLPGTFVTDFVQILPVEFPGWNCSVWLSQVELSDTRTKSAKFTDWFRRNPWRTRASPVKIWDLLRWTHSRKSPPFTVFQLRRQFAEESISKRHVISTNCYYLIYTSFTHSIKYMKYHLPAW